MFHNYWLKSLSAYLDNELSESKKQKIQSHLKGCQICQSHLAEWEKTKVIQKGFQLIQPDEAIWYSISRQMKEKPVRPLRFWEDDWVTRYIPNPIPAIATAALVILLVIGLQPYFQTTDTSSETLEQYLSNEMDSSTSANLDNFVSLADKS